METRHDGLSRAGRARQLRLDAQGGESADGGVDGHGVHESGHAQHQRAPRATLPRHHLPGRDYDKWREAGLTPVPGVANRCFYVAESPRAIECRVKDIILLGSHDLFLAEVLGLLADEQYIDPETGAFDMARAGLMAYVHGGYFALGEKLGHFGFSVRKKKGK